MCTVNRGSCKNLRSAFFPQCCRCPPGRVARSITVQLCLWRLDECGKAPDVVHARSLTDACLSRQHQTQRAAGSIRCGEHTRRSTKMEHSSHLFEPNAAMSICGRARGRQGCGRATRHLNCGSCPSACAVSTQPFSLTQIAPRVQDRTRSTKRG
jgi:hypothetical protein